MDTIVSALHAYDSVGTEYIAFPKTNISAVQGLEDELKKAITNLMFSGGTLTVTKGDGTTTETTISIATTTAAGLMSAADKTKLNGVATNANNYSLPTATSGVLGGVKIGSNITNSGGTISLSSVNVTSALGYTPPRQDTTYTLPAATSSALGGVKIGSNITNSSGTISLSSANVTSALGFTPAANTSGSNAVTGVKGNAESSYRTGNVNITAANVGAAASSHNHAAGDITSGALPVARGGTRLTANPSMLTNLGTTAAANILTSAPRPGVTGTLSIANGGTGLTANPSMLINLAATAAANVLTASPRPGVTGILPIANGGTGRTDGGFSVIKFTGVNGVNANEMTTPGWYRIQSGTNFPTGTYNGKSYDLNYGLLLVLNPNITYVSDGTATISRTDVYQVLFTGIGVTSGTAVAGKIFARAAVTASWQTILPSTMLS